MQAAGTIYLELSPSDFFITATKKRVSPMVMKY